MKKEEDKYLMDHEYDGIQEFNFPLPNWWLMSFVGGIIIGIGYISYYIFLNGPSLKHDYYADSKKMEAIREAYIAELTEFKPGKFKSFYENEGMKMYGATVFNNNCIACHNQNAAGDIGPNLTDKYWIYTEGTAKTFHEFIIEGSPVSGMPAWGNILTEDEMYALGAYIKSLQGFAHVDPPAKEADGDLYE